MKKNYQTLLRSIEFEVVSLDLMGAIAKRERKRNQYYRQNLGDGIYIDMMFCPGGVFRMGNPEGDASNHRNAKKPFGVSIPQAACLFPERSTRWVEVLPFYIGRFPITQAQWKSVSNLPIENYALYPDLSYYKGKNRPVECVSWLEAVEFCKRLARQSGRKYRLPSEAEWEYACRAGTKTDFHFGHVITTDVANNYPSREERPGGRYRKGITDVGLFPANAWGLHDMHGNVWEWCLDHYHKSYHKAPTDGSPWIDRDIDGSDRRIFRGGSYCYSAFYCTSHRRIYRISESEPPNARGRNLGFRIVCDI
jgi:formylglycine-generating enzyme required for sulfatase activity